MKISILWLDSAIQKWEITENKNNYNIAEYYVRDGCIDFHGKKISNKPLPLVQSEEERDFIIPLNTIRAIEIDKDA